ncbi:hypothetical protein LCGC14_2453120, partial [marine sediment metagenome]
LRKVAYNIAQFAPYTQPFAVICKGTFIYGKFRVRIWWLLLYSVRTMWTTLPPDLRDGLVLVVGA